MKNALSLILVFVVLARFGEAALTGLLGKDQQKESPLLDLANSADARLLAETRGVDEQNVVLIRGNSVQTVQVQGNAVVNQQQTSVPLGDNGLLVQVTGGGSNEIEVEEEPSAFEKAGTIAIDIIRAEGRLLKSAIKIKSKLVAPFVALGAKVAAPIIKLKAKIAAPIIKAKAFLAKPLIKTGAKLAAPSIAFGKLTTATVAPVTKPIIAGAKEAFSPVTEAFQPLVDATQPAKDAINLGLLGFKVEDEVNKVNFQDDFDNLSEAAGNIAFDVAQLKALGVNAAVQAAEGAASRLAGGSSRRRRQADETGMPSNVAELVSMTPPNVPVDGIPTMMQDNVPVDGIPTMMQDNVPMDKIPSIVQEHVPEENPSQMDAMQPSNPNQNQVVQETHPNVMGEEEEPAHPEAPEDDDGPTVVIDTEMHVAEGEPIPDIEIDMEFV